MKIPQHIAIILDGNGRWAKSKGMPRNYGHTVGAKNVETILRAAGEMGIRYVTMYAFSTENWNRPADEVEALMKLLNNYLKNCIKTARKNNLRVRVIGDISRLDEDMQKRITELEEESKSNTGLQFQIALNYGACDAPHGTGSGRTGGYHRGALLRIFRYQRNPGPGSIDPHKRRAAAIQLSALAACVQ